MFTQRTTTENNYHFEAAALPHMRDLHRAARRMMRSQTDAEEVVQEVYLQAWKSFHRFEPGTNCRAWLFKIMHHVIDHHRRKLSRLVSVGEEEQYIFDDLAWEPPVSQELSDDELIAALGRVPENYRLVILLADVYEYAYREIAEMLRIPLGTVMSRLSRGRNILRTELAGNAGWTM